MDKKEFLKKVNDFVNNYGNDELVALSFDYSDTYPTIANFRYITEFIDENEIEVESEYNCFCNDYIYFFKDVVINNSHYTEGLYTWTYDEETENVKFTNFLHPSALNETETTNNEVKIVTNEINREKVENTKIALNFTESLKNKSQWEEVKRIIDNFFE